MKQGERLIYPTERLVGIADGRGQVESVLRALREAGVADERVEVLTAESTQFLEDPPSDDHLAERVTHVLQTVLGDETERLEALKQALDGGRVVVQVRLTEDDGDREEAKHRLGRLMADHGLEGVAFYGRWQIEEIQLGA